MSDSQWRIDLAREIAEYYDAQVIILTGSAAIGLAHAYSDIDIVMYWNQETLPQDEERFSIAESLGGTKIVLDPFDGKAEFSLQDVTETLYLSTLKVDITHKTV